MFDHHRGDRRNLNPLATYRISIGTLQMGSAAAAMLWPVLHHLITALCRQQSRPWTRMTSLPTTLKATGLLEWSRLKSRACPERRFR